MIITRQELEARMIQVISRCTDEWLAVHAAGGQVIDLNEKIEAVCRRFRDGNIKKEL